MCENLAMQTRAIIALLAAAISTVFTPSIHAQPGCCAARRLDAGRRTVVAVKNQIATRPPSKEPRP